VRATTSRCTRASGSRSSPTRARSSRRRAELRSDDPLGFFDLRPYTERLAEAELATGLGEAMVIGARRSTSSRASSR
jgi:acetyl-CoA carboxylase beta subunit